jgi:hypothetical protein
MLLLQLATALELGVDNMPMLDSRLLVLPVRRVSDFLLRGDVFLIGRPNIYGRITSGVNKCQKVKNNQGR